MGESTEDPVLGRLEDGLQRARDLELRGLAGETVPPEVLATESRAIRDDMVAERRAFLAYRKGVADTLKEIKASMVPRKPLIIIGTILLPILTGITVVVVGSLLTGGSPK